MEILSGNVNKEMRSDLEEVIGRDHEEEQSPCFTLIYLEIFPLPLLFLQLLQKLFIHE